MSDIDTAAADSLKVLDPERPIREADIALVDRDFRCWTQSEHGIGAVVSLSYRQSQKTRLAPRYATQHSRKRLAVGLHGRNVQIVARWGGGSEAETRKYVEELVSLYYADGYVIDSKSGKTGLGRGSSDAALMPYHVDRSKLFVKERIAQSKLLDADRISSAIECTRFPPVHGRNDENSEGLLVRAADLIGQLGDPHFSEKPMRCIMTLKKLE